MLAGRYRGQPVAIKTFRSPRAEDHAAVKREAETLAGLSHPNLVGFVGVCAPRARLKLVFEFSSGGDLYELLHGRCDIDVSRAQHRRMGMDVAQAMNYLHSHTPPIIHRDLSSS